MDTSNLMYPKPVKKQKAKKRTYFNSTIPITLKPRKTAGRGIKRANLMPSKVIKAKTKKIKKEVEDLAKLVAKTRDGWRCKKCGKFVKGHDAHGSHIIPVSKGNSLRYNPKNIFCMCYHCHLNWWHKNPVEAGEWFAKNFPELKIYLDERKNLKVKFTYEDFERMKIELTKQLQELQEKNIS